jgi:chaperonin GroES
MLKPIFDKVVVLRDSKEDKSPGGIYIPEGAQKETTRGLVVAVGPGRFTADGERLDMSVAKGDRVLFANYTGHDYKDEDGTKYLIINEHDILAVIE